MPKLILVALAATVRVVGDLQSLTLDWITRNIYVATDGGFIRACNTQRSASSLPCATVLSGLGWVHAVAIHPENG